MNSNDHGTEAGEDLRQQDSAAISALPSFFAGTGVLYTLLSVAVSTLVCTIALGIGMGDQGRHLGYSWLLNAWFILSICLGAIFFVAIQHLTRSGWSVSMRRTAEVIGASIVGPVLLLLPVVITLLLGYSGLFLWNNAELVSGDSILKGKQGFLNAPFFAVRTMLYSAVWIAAGLWLLKTSQRQDVSGDPKLTLLMERRSAPLLIGLALTTTFAAFDWLMSLDPYWFSTIFGIYVFAGGMVGALAILAIVAAVWLKSGTHATLVTHEHLHDTAKLLFGFNCFWAYIAFSQYLLIWYANIPEETIWLKHRQEHGWGLITMTLIFGHFIIPFVVLMPRAAKRNPNLVIAVALLLLAMHWLDLYWLVYPQLSRSPIFGPVEVMGLLFFLSAMGVCTRWFSADHLPVAVGDPRLHESVTHHVV